MNTRGRNRLAQESSPYLLLHAENPVDWYPWGTEAFERAQREDKPIFLSVGYSTCYWCHVMERECFSNSEIAEKMNRGFVSVKLDREERPDLDEIYMTATQILTRSGGWPNSLFLTPEAKPFFAGTYFPPRDSLGRPGFPRVLDAIAEAWTLRRSSIVEQAEAVTAAISDQVGRAGALAVLQGDDLAETTQEALAQRFDSRFGGFGGAPKFPSPSNLFFLLDRARSGQPEALTMLKVSLDRMARGGIHDQLAGGFHRYSTDAEWLVPHFEKMLYDNAALATLYAETSGLAPEAGFSEVARRTLDFVLQELSGPQGFLSAIDAETDGHEGAYYTWTKQELQGILGDASPRLASVWGFDGDPNFEEDRYVLHLPRRLEEVARESSLSLAALRDIVDEGRKALLEVRWQRKRPLVDDKILTDWNGMMIGAMTRAGVILEEPRYLAAARKAAEFVLEHLFESPGVLLHSYRGGKARVVALLDDYAFLIQGLLQLHQSKGEAVWLDACVRLCAEQDRRLWDEKGGAYFMAGENPELLVRPKPGHDGAVPCGNGIAVLNLIELSDLTGDRTYLERASSALRAFGETTREWPLAHVTLVRGLEQIRPRLNPSVTSSARTSVVTAHAKLLGDVEGAWKAFEVDLRIEAPWHVNANPASLPFLVPTELSAQGGALRRVRYPEGEEVRVSFADETLSVYRGRVRIEGEVDVKEGAFPRLKLTYQACDEARCVAPVTEEVPFR